MNDGMARLENDGMKDDMHKTSNMAQSSPPSPGLLLCCPILDVAYLAFPSISSQHIQVYAFY